LIAVDRESGLPDYYSLFQISPGASQMEIVNAYRHAKLAYQQDSLAVYSLFSEEELDNIRQEIEEAYRVLSDPEKRRDYDLLCDHADEGATPPGVAVMENVIPLHRQPDEGLTELASYCGAAFRQLREKRGITLEAIAERTKISKRYLQAIEHEDAANFPEAVYLKGYLRQYCREIGVDPELALPAYLELFVAED